MSLVVTLLTDAFPPIVDGVCNVVVNYAKYIRKQGGKSIVAAPSYPGTDDSYMPFPVVRYPSIDVRKITTGYTAGIPFSASLADRMIRQKSNIIHVHSPMMAAVLGRALRKRMQAPMILTYHTKYDIDIANVVKSKALQASGIKSVVTNAASFDEVWAVSDGAGKNLQSMGYQGDYYVMRNGVDFPKARASAEEVENEVRGYDLPAGVPVFLFVGRLMWYKGIRITLDALRMIREKGIDFRMVIIGEGGDGAAIRSYTKELGLSDRVFFTGLMTDRDRVRAWYTRADLFLFPSTFDSNGLVVREASACDLPSVLIAGSSAAEEVTDGRNAFLIEENAASMAQMLTELCKKMDFVHQTGIHAGQDLYLSWDDAVKNAMDRYQTVLDIYKSGGYKEHGSISDNLLATNGDLMYTIARITKAMNQGRVMAKYITKQTKRKIKNSK